MRKPREAPGAHAQDEILGAGKFVRLIRRDGWEFIDHPHLRGIAVIVAITPGQELLLVEQYRTPVHARTIELPAGVVGDKAGHEQEPFEAGAARELEEETGWTASHFRFLASGPGSPGRTRYFYHFFAAEGLRCIGPGGGDAEEDIRVHAVPLRDIRAWLHAREAEGLVVDTKIYAGLYLLND